jgi:hypothetical protein
MHQVDMEEAKTHLPDLIEAAIRGIEVVIEHVMDKALAAQSPRARQYVGWPLLLLMRLHHRRGISKGG